MRFYGTVTSYLLPSLPHPSCTFLLGSLASMVSRGRKVASPSKKVRREGDLEIFLQLAANVGLMKPGYKGEFLDLRCQTK